MSFLTLNLRPTIELTDEQFEQICRSNPELRLERTASSELVIMSPTGSETGGQNSSITGQLWAWNYQSRLGKTFDSSTGFKLPNGATRSPDAAWISLERWETLTAAQRRGFASICPDFVVELRFPGDDKETIQAKMQEYIANGLRLGWLIDPEARLVEIYRADQAVEIIHNPVTLSGEAVLPGFVLDLAEIFAG